MTIAIGSIDIHQNIFSIIGAISFFIKITKRVITYKLTREEVCIILHTIEREATKSKSTLLLINAPIKMEILGNEDINCCSVKKIKAINIIHNDIGFFIETFLVIKSRYNKLINV